MPPFRTASASEGLLGKVSLRVGPVSQDESSLGGLAPRYLRSTEQFTQKKQVGWRKWQLCTWVKVLVWHVTNLGSTNPSAVRVILSTEPSVSPEYSHPTPHVAPDAREEKEVALRM